jgi:two-component system chemotaxis sensor kinase CheA
LDLAKYRQIFLEEAAEHLGEMSRALLQLEKDPRRAEAIDVLFRMAHSIKGMAASLDHHDVAETAHRFEDRMQEIRSAGGVAGAELPLLFREFETLEAGVAQVRDAGAGGGEGVKKKS